MASRLSAQKWIIWLMLVSLSFEIALSLSVEDQVEETEESRISKWKSDLENLFKQAQSGAGKAVGNFWNPKKKFIEDAWRWQKWYAEYSKLCNKRKSQETNCLQANDFFLSEYAKIDSKLYAERREIELKRAELADEKPDESSVEQSGYLSQLLGRLLNHLEALQEAFEYELEPLPTTTDQEAVDESMKRLRRILLSTLADLAKGEGIELARMAAFKLLAIYLAHSPPAPDNPLSVAAPIIAMLGAADTPLLPHYLMNIKIRAAIKAVDGLNPLPLIFAKLTGKAVKQLEDETADAITTLAPEVDAAKFALA